MGVFMKFTKVNLSLKKLVVNASIKVSGLVFKYEVVTKEKFVLLMCIIFIKKEVRGGDCDEGLYQN